MRLSKDNQSDHDQIREALLNNFNLTERQFKRKFRESRPENRKPVGSLEVDWRVI